MPYKSGKKKKVNYKKLKAITKQRKKAKKKIKKEVCDDAEFTQCQHCQSAVLAYNNTTRSSMSTPICSEYTKQLLAMHSCNCEKCGKYLEFHPERSADASIIFVCSNSAKPCSHALCYDCGILYDLKTETDAKMDIVKALSAECGAESPEPADSSDSADGSQSDEEDKNPKVEADVSMIASVAPLTIVAEMMHGMDSHMDMSNKEMTVHTNEQRNKSDKQSSDSLIIGAIMALLVSNYVFGTMKMQRKLKILPLICIFAAIAYCVAVNFLSTDPDYTALNVTIDLDLDENIEYDTITKG